MLREIRGTLQLDFDGTLAEGDVSTGILARFVAPEWTYRVDEASRRMATDPNSPELISTMRAGYAGLGPGHEAYLAHAHEHHPARPGLAELIDAADRLGLEPHIVSNGFQFYIRDYLRREGVESRIRVHTGEASRQGDLVYFAPDGRPTTSRFKLSWAEHFLAQRDLFIYVGDGSSDLAPARLAGIVFARDSLLSSMPRDFAGSLRPFETLLDVAKGLEELLG
jgi:2-hydroxy-3-keto-5-methylthiopentenyl-1-phosphate phosphatase